MLTTDLKMPIAVPNEYLNKPIPKSSAYLSSTSALVAVITATKALVLDKYALDFGIGLFRYSFGTAIGIFKSVVSIALLLLANSLAKRAGRERLF